jgi:hypothetical protein
MASSSEDETEGSERAIKKLADSIVDRFTPMLNDPFIRTVFKNSLIDDLQNCEDIFGSGGSVGVLKAFVESSLIGC